ncbi:hypothetical protein HAX54_030901, partial [Datura stramonium]|nr:hypothetical protein [Datura stramonium]
MTNNLQDKNQVQVEPVRYRRNAGGEPQNVVEPPVLYRKLGEILSIRQHTSVSPVLTSEVQVKYRSGQRPEALHLDL